MSADLSSREQVVLDYMRGNGAKLTPGGRAALMSRGVWTASQVSRAVNALIRKGYAERVDALEDRLTRRGRRDG